MRSIKTFNDLVDDLHRQLVNESAEYRALLRATSNAEAVEGSLLADDACAAQMIRDEAARLACADVATAKLAVIGRALGVVLRRYHASRKQRRRPVLKAVTGGRRPVRSAAE
jgi:hypothetical protein